MWQFKQQQQQQQQHLKKIPKTKQDIWVIGNKAVNSLSQKSLGLH